jgi:hypothetical protein
MTNTATIDQPSPTPASTLATVTQVQPTLRMTTRQALTAGAKCVAAFRAAINLALHRAQATPGEDPGEYRADKAEADALAWGRAHNAGQLAREVETVLLPVVNAQRTIAIPYSSPDQAYMLPARADVRLVIPSLAKISETKGDRALESEATRARKLLTDLRMATLAMSQVRQATLLVAANQPKAKAAKPPGVRAVNSISKAAHDLKAKLDVIASVNPAMAELLKQALALVDTNIGAIKATYDAAKGA